MLSCLQGSEHVRREQVRHEHVR
ncbi:hypothetical protein ACN6K4_005161 [Streptomyces hayashii]